jgi:hypothetical protein
MDAMDEAERGLTVIQDYLYWDSHRRVAHRRAAEFAAHVPGLSEGQKTDDPPRVGARGHSRGPEGTARDHPAR